MENRSNIIKAVTELINSSSGKEVNLSKMTIGKFDHVLSLISCNIKLSSEHNNFDKNEFRIDKSSVFNYKMKYSTTGNISQIDISDLNKIHQKHKKIAKLLVKG